MARIRTRRLKVGRAPTGLVMTGPALRVFESGSGKLSDYALSDGRRLGRVTLPGPLDVDAGLTAHASNLIQGRAGEWFAWTWQSESLRLFRVLEDRVVARATLHAPVIREWGYGAASHKLAMTFAGARTIGFTEDGRVVRERAVDFELGSVTFDGTGQRVLAASMSGDRILVLDARTEQVIDELRLGFQAGSDFKPLGAQLSFQPAPLLLRGDRVLYVGAWLFDRAELTSPVLVVDMRHHHVRAIRDSRIRAPYAIHDNPRLPELYVVGYDFTVVLDLERSAVVHVFEPGRLSGFAVAPNGRWAAGVTLFGTALLIFDVESRRVESIPLNGRFKGEPVNVPVVIDSESAMVAVPDVTADELVIAEVRV